MRMGEAQTIRAPAALTAALAIAALAFAPAAPAAPSKQKVSVRGIEVSPAAAAPGAAVRVSGELRNRGKRDARPKVRALLDGDPGLPLGQRRFAVEAKDEREFTLDGAIPAAVAVGTHDVVVCVVRRGKDRCRRARGALRVFDTGTPGARSLGDPLFPEVGNGGFDVRHYDVAIRWVAAGDQFVDGTATTITARATQALSQFSLDLEGLTVGSISVDGAPASFARAAPAACSSATPPDPCPPTKLVITPAQPIADGATFTVRIAYTGGPGRHTDPDGSDEGWADTADGAFVVNEPVGAMTWMPNNNHPADKATYAYELTVPTTTTAVGNGELVAPPADNGDGTRTWRWRSTDPLSSYLSTGTVGDFDFAERATVNGLPLYDFIDSAYSGPEKAATQLLLDRHGSVIDFFTGLYGPYPFDSGGSVVDNSDVGYALEVQTKSHYSAVPVDPTTFAHEIAHEWFGNSVTLRTWKDIWLNEGWAGWSEWIWDNEENGNPTTPAQQFDVNFTPGTKWNTAPADPTAAGLFSSFPTYTRPAMMLQALREIIGNGRFLTMAREWQAGNRHGHGTTAEFISLGKQASGFSGANLAKLDTFFQQWLFGTSQPTITGDNFFTP